MSIDLPEAHRAILADILHRHLPDHALWVFGSRARGDAKPHSDVDIFAAGPTIEGLARAKLELALEESDLPYRVDLVFDGEIHEALRDRITAERQPFK